jgi:hypothetical protein
MFYFGFMLFLGWGRRGWVSEGQKERGGDGGLGHMKLKICYQNFQTSPNKKEHVLKKKF